MTCECKKEGGVTLTIKCSLCGHESKYIGTLSECIGMAKMDNWIIDPLSKKQYCDDSCACMSVQEELEVA